MTLPKHIHAQLMHAFTQGRPAQDWYPIHDERTNAYLCDTLGLGTDYNTHRLNNSFTVRFNWNNFLWYVST